MDNDLLSSHGKNQPATAGIAWYRPDTFEQCRATFDDADAMHDTYEQWLADAESTEATARRQGLTVIRINIDPVEFPKWCQQEGFTEINGHARSSYVSVKAKETTKRRRRGRK